MPPDRKSEIQDGGPKPEVLISKLVEEIESKFQRLHPCFRGPTSQWNSMNDVRHKPEVGIPRWRLDRWISGFRFGRTAFWLLALSCWTPKHGVAIGISFISHLQADI